MSVKGAKKFEDAEDAVNRNIDDQTSGHRVRAVEDAEDAVRRGIDDQTRMRTRR